MKNLMEKIESTVGHINPRYDASYKDIVTIANNSRDFYNLICNGFRFGYMQGYKAALAEQKKKARSAQ